MILKIVKLLLIFGNQHFKLPVVVSLSKPTTGNRKHKRQCTTVSTIPPRPLKEKSIVPLQKKQQKQEKVNCLTLDH